MSRAVVAVATSGGRDSTALLHATARIARPLGVEVVALHVHHGLMPQADGWLSFVRSQTALWRRAGLPVSLLHARLSGQPAASDSVEAWARRKRYEALAAMADEAGASVILLAHHRQDQAETFLLQALRGGAPRGLASMPAVAHRDGLRWARPWLDIESAAIDAYIRRHRLRHVDDPSNRQPRFARSRLRSLVWPSLVSAFPEAETALSAAAARAQETSDCLYELAEIDACSCIDAQQRLSIEPWLALSPARRANLLRHWLQRCMARGAPQSLVHRLSHECTPIAGTRRWPADGGQVIQYRGRLIWRPGRAASSGSADEAVVRLDLSSPGRYAVERWHGHFVVQPARGAGVPAALLAACELRARQGAERFQFHARSMPRSLKKQFQAAAVPAQARGGPLVFVDRQLVFVPGLGLDARVCQDGAADLRTLAWVEDEA